MCGLTPPRLNPCPIPGAVYPKIRVPVLAISGALDSSDNLRMAARVAETVADGRSILIENTAHYPNMEQPAAFNTNLKSFLKHT
ncbi:alpha/beta fold hydrolase [Arthrobacter pigmenti]